MVAQPSSTVARGSASMLAGAAWMLLLLSGFSHATSGRRYNADVSNDDVMIDNLKDLLSSRRQVLRQLVSPAGHPRRQDVNEKIEFAVTPQDERFNNPPTPSRHEASPPGSDLLRFLSPDLSLQPRLDYPAGLLQYQYDDIQYPTEYAAPFRPPYRPQEHRLRPDYLPHPALHYPRLYSDGLGEERLVGLREEVEEEEEENEGAEENVEDARELLRKELAGDADYGGESQLMRKKGHTEKDPETSEGVEVTDEAAPDTPITAKLVPTSQPETMKYMHLLREPSSNHESSYSIKHGSQGTPDPQLSDVYFTAVLAGCTAVAVCAVVGAGICWYRLNKSHKAAQDTEYPAYGVTGPNKDISPSGDRKLAQSAHMYHYQHQKQQMIALEKSSGAERHGSTSDVDSEEEGEENEYTVYECPGLAPTGEMEVKNPLFHDDPTPATPSIRKEAEQDHRDEDKTNK